MKKVLKQIVGIDVAQDELVVCLGRLCVVLSSGEVIIIADCPPAEADI